MLNPVHGFLLVTQQACIGAVFLAEMPRHPGVGDVVDLMGSGAKDQSIHNARHVAGDAAAGLRFRQMMRVLCDAGGVLELSMASRAHEVRLVRELQCGGVRSGIVSMRFMASSAAHLPFLKALRALQSFPHERRLPKAAVLIKALAGKLAEGNIDMLAEKISRTGIIQLSRRARLPDRGLLVTLRANRNKAPTPRLGEI